MNKNDKIWLATCSIPLLIILGGAIARALNPTPNSQGPGGIDGLGVIMGLLFIKISFIGIGLLITNVVFLFKLPESFTKGTAEIGLLLSVAYFLVLYLIFQF